MSVRVTLPIFAVAALGTAVACNFNPGPEPAGQHQAVVGGTIAENDPAVIALHSGSWLICTGTLVSPAVVLTAAHCIDDFSTDPDATVFFGFDVSTDDGVRIGVKKAQQHLGWTGNLGDGHDIGLMLLNFAPADDVKSAARRQLTGLGICSILRKTDCQAARSSPPWTLWGEEGIRPIDGQERRSLTLAILVSCILSDPVALASSPVVLGSRRAGCGNRGSMPRNLAGRRRSC